MGDRRMEECGARPEIDNMSHLIRLGLIICYLIHQKPLFADFNYFRCARSIKLQLIQCHEHVNNFRPKNNFVRKLYILIILSFIPQERIAIYAA
jgi:hypothetical protein